MVLASFRAFCAVFAAGVSLVAGNAAACQPITRRNVVACALAQSLDARREREQLAALAGRRVSASLLLPSNPVLSLNGGLPAVGEVSRERLTWGVGLSQELEIAGQRGHRLDAVAAQRSAAEKRALVKQREVARTALLAYYDVLAARARAEVAEQLGALGGALSEHAEARAEAGLDAPVTASIAQAEARRLAQLRLAGELELARTTAALTSLLGGDPSQRSAQVVGELQPLPVAETPLARAIARALEQRAELEVARAERDAARESALLARASRVPNPTVSLYLRQDWIGERVAGVGLAVPVPLPAPVGRTFAGERQEAEALARRGQLDLEKLQRSVRLEVVEARQTLESRQRQAALFEPSRSIAARAQLLAIAEALRERKLLVRDALLAERALVEQWFDEIEAQHALCSASVDLAWVSGAALERGAP